MATMKKVFFLLVISSLLLTGACNLFPDDPELPPITMEGKNTFGCLVDGKFFLPRAPVGYGAGVRVEIQNLTDTVGINIYASNVSTKQTLIISLFDTPNLIINKIYDDSENNFTIDYLDYDMTSSCHYNSILSAKITLSKFDISGTNKIIAGTFEFSAHSNDCNKTVFVTKGRFDIGDVN